MMPSSSDQAGVAPLPYKIATLCDLRDKDGRVLLLRRLKSPNFGMVSPIGGKLDVHTGESPAQCARREIAEEAGIDVPIERLHLLGMISETAYEGKSHWLIFYYRVLGPVWTEPRQMREGELAWFAKGELGSLPLPETDRRILWPLVDAHEAAYVAGKAARPGFFAVHIDCDPALKSEQNPIGLVWKVEQSLPAV
jgi:8-oxo-dGTP diphosphatase